MLFNVKFAVFSKQVVFGIAKSQMKGPIFPDRKNREERRSGCLILRGAPVNYTSLHVIKALLLPTL